MTGTTDTRMESFLKPNRKGKRKARVTETTAAREYTELVGYTGHDECLEVRYCTRASQVWDYGVDHGVGLGKKRLGYWIGTDLLHRFVGRERSDVEEYAARNLDGSPVRFLEPEAPAGSPA